MMPLSEIARLVRTLDGERRSPVADVVAAAWGYPPGAARHHRSSATHVFRAGDAGGRVFLRFVPVFVRARPHLAAVAGLMSDLAARLPVARPVPSAAGRLVETVDTGCGPMHAMALRAAPGESVEPAALTSAQTRAVGAALARLHGAWVSSAGSWAGSAPTEGPGARVGTAGALPEWFGELDLARDVFAGDPALADAIEALSERLAALPRDAGRYGLVHGDFEPDNLSFDGDTVTAYDFDEAGRSWFVADIAAAVGDLSPAQRVEFVAGYRAVRDLPDVELAELPWFADVQLARWLVRLPQVLDAGDSAADPDWLVRLRHRLDRLATHRRAAILQKHADIR